MFTISTIAPPSTFGSPGGTKIQPLLRAALEVLAGRARDHGYRGRLTLAEGQITASTWRGERYRYVDWLNADCPQPGRSTSWSPRMRTSHVPEWGEDLAHGGWAAVLDFAEMNPRKATGETWVASLEAWVDSFWRDLLAEAGLHLVSSVPHTTGFGRVVPAHLVDSDQPTVRALNGVAGVFGGGQNGAQALALSWLRFEGAPVIDPRELTPSVREHCASIGLDIAAPASVLLHSPAVMQAIGRHRDRLAGSRESYDGDA